MWEKIVVLCAQELISSFSWEEVPTVLTTDKLEAQKLVYYPVLYSRTKLVDIHQHIMQETLNVLKFVMILTIIIPVCVFLSQ
jgi:hypothetical protein